MSAAEAQALRALLAARQQAGGTTPARSRPGQPVRRPRPGGRPAPKRARTRSAARRTRDGDRRWWPRLAAVTSAVLVLPVLASLALPGPTTSRDGGPDGTTRLALAASTSLAGHAQEYRALEAELTRRRIDLAKARQAVDTARAATETRRQVVGAQAADLFRAPVTDRLPVFGLDLRDPGAADDVLYSQAMADRADRALEGAVVRADRAAARLADAARRVTDVERRIAVLDEQASTVLAATRDEAAQLTPTVSGRIAALGGTAAAGARQERNERAVTRWQSYLAGLDEAGIELPTAAELADPESLPSGLAPALGSDGNPVPGVAWAVAGNSPVTVLPVETVTAVSTALAQVGKPFAADAPGPDTFGCAGLTATAWLFAGYALPSSVAAQWRTGAAVPMSDLQVGDLVVSPGGRDVGLFLGGRDVLGASASSYQVGVRTLPAGASAVRVTLPSPAEPNAPLPEVPGALDCGATPPPREKVSPAWGGWANGTIPSSALCRLGVHEHALRCDAAAGYAALADAYEARFGTRLCITDSYRSLGAQVTAYALKPHLVAVPGTSNHGWALAVDLCGGVNHGGSAQWRWMTVHAGRFGWVQPDWAGPRGEKPEPWHWEFGVIS